MLETFFSCKYTREIKHNSLTLLQSLPYDRLATHKVHTPTIENTDNDVLDT